MRCMACLLVLVVLLGASPAHAEYSDEEKVQICDAVRDRVGYLITVEGVKKRQMFDEIIPGITDPTLRTAFEAVAKRSYRSELRGNDSDSLRAKLQKACLEALE